MTRQTKKYLPLCRNCNCARTYTRSCTDNSKPPDGRLGNRIIVMAIVSKNSEFYQGSKQLSYGDSRLAKALATSRCGRFNQQLILRVSTSNEFTIASSLGDLVADLCGQQMHLYMVFLMRAAVHRKAALY